MILSCAIIDDEPLAVKLMESYVLKTPFLRLEGSFNSAASAFSRLSESPVDLLFCDIQMPQMNGVELSRILPQETKVIFTTAFSQYAVEGFRVNAMDYLLKPVSYTDFLSAADRAREWFEIKKASQEARSGAGKAGVPGSIFVRTEHRLQQVSLDSIQFIEGFKDYVKIYTENEPDPVLSLMSLKSLQDQLPAGKFVRVHRSYIVQLTKIRSIERDRIVFDKKIIPVSDTYRQEFYDSLSRQSLLP